MKWHRYISNDNVTKTNTETIYKEFHDQESDKSTNTPATEEGNQNSRDQAILKEIEEAQSLLEVCKHEDVPLIKIKKVKVSKSFFEKIIDKDFQDWAKDSPITDKFFLANQLDKEEEIEVLLFEDFNTTGLSGDPKQHKPILDDGTRNDYHVFLYHIGSIVEKGKNKGGSVGVGRFTFVISSKINTFFVYTKQHGKNSKTFFTGMANFGKSTNNPYLDNIARYGNEGKSPQGNTISMPLHNQSELDTIREGFKLQRNQNETGASMIVPFPKENLSYENMIINTIQRYRYNIYLNHFKTQIGEILISRDTIKDVVKKYIKRDYEKYLEYFNFLDECLEIKKNEKFIKFNIEKSNPTRFKEEDFDKTDFLKIKDDFKNDRVIAIKLPLTINSYIDGIKDKEEKEFPSTVDIFIKKTSQGYGMDDMIRGPMSVSGERKFERTDVFGLTHINEPESKEMFRLIESTNHKKFNNFNQEVEQLYWKFVNQKSLVVNATETLKNIILDSETKFDSDAASDFFNFGKQEDDDEKKGAKSTYKKKGPDSQFNLPLALFSNPKSYKIEKVEEKNLAGFKIKNENFKENCKDTIKKIDEFIEKNKDNPSLTIKLKKQLELQKIKNTEWLNDKNLDALYPSKISIYCAEDLDGKNDKDSFKLHDKFLDFDLSNKLKHTIITEKKGDISDVEVENGNHIIISVNGPEFFYKILTDAFTLSLTKDHSDLRVSATMTTYKNEKTIKLHK